MKKCIITGGPHTGKTTLLEALKIAYPDLHYVPEPAVAVITAEFAKQESDPRYKGVFPWEDYKGFRTLVIEKSQELEEAVPGGAEVVILDRSLVDNVAYTRLNGMEDLLWDLDAPIKDAEYDLAFLCDFVGTYTQTKERRETFEEAKVLHGEIARAYKESGMWIVDLPPVSVEDRVKLVGKWV